MKEAEDAADELRRQLEAVVLQKKALEEQLQEFSRTLSQRDELIAQLRAGREVQCLCLAGKCLCVRASGKSRVASRTRCTASAG